ncbi:NADH-quinone oxidoreductase subunit A [Blochmannia endosymbiont of Camponotus sp. C-003]|uniref:NADH-quinone oxidoreductase subunit A n=1 Tax=unclassified Candidatus Blochmanniella TaxID=711328 RepID=UPI003B22841C
MLSCGYLMGGRSSSRFKNVPFESGIKSIGNARIPFSIKFYLVAMLFVIFDVEGIYVYAWAISIRDVGWIGFIEMFVFIFILLVSLLYLTRIGMFDWVEESSRYVHNVDYFNVDTSRCLKKVIKGSRYEIYFNDSSNK